MSGGKQELYERALAQIRRLTLTDLSRDQLQQAILAVLETAGITAKLAKYYRDEAAKD